MYRSAYQKVDVGSQEVLTLQKIAFFDFTDMVGKTGIVLSTFHNIKRLE